MRRADQKVTEVEGARRHKIELSVDHPDFKNSEGVLPAGRGTCGLTLIDAVTRLNQSTSLDKLLCSFASTVADVTAAQSAFVLLADPANGGLDFSRGYGTEPVSEVRLLRLQAYLGERPDARMRLNNGREAQVDGSALLLIPLPGGSGLCAVEGMQVSEGFGLVKELCRHVAPLVARMQELDGLRRENAERTSVDQKTRELENSLARLLQDKGNLEAIIEIKSHILSNVAHELRTPLVAVRGYTKMILSGAAGPINDTQREYLTIVSENTNRLVRLIGNFLRFSATQQLRLECFDLRDLWQDVSKLITPQLLEKSIRLNEKIPSRPSMITGDRERLALVFHNLLSNAVRFTDCQGEITVEFLYCNGDEITIKVSDTGAGIPQELLDKIFDRYYQADGLPSRGYDAAGIGLSVVHDIIRLHGGRISVTSEVGEGSTFIFTLPSVQASKQEEVAPGNEQAIDPCRR